MRVATIKTLVFEGLESSRRLGELGITADDLREVVLRGEQAAQEATAHDPVTAAGTDAYRYRVRTFRDLHTPKGWRVDRRLGVELTVSSDGRMAVITRAGDEGVGIMDAFPQPKRAVGKGTQDAIDSGSLFLDVNWMNVVASPNDETDVWMLLVFRSGDLVRYELSLPSGVDEDGGIMGWKERIVGSSLDLRDPTLPRRQEPEEPAVVDVPVTKKVR